MAVNVLGRAWIEVHADTSPFARELMADITTITTAAEKQSHTAGQRIGRGLGEGMEREARRAGPRVGTSLFRSLTSAFRRSGNRQILGGNIGTRLIGEAADIGSRMGASLGGAFAKGAGSGIQAVGKGLLTVVSSIGSSIGNVGANGPLAPLLGALIIFGIPALIGAVISLITVLGPLLNLLFLVPAALGGLAAAIIPVVVAFDGFGTAVSALASGDLRAINEAMKELTPSARAVAREVAAIVPSFKELRSNAQEGFFSGLGVGKIAKAWDKLIGTLLLGFFFVGQAAGRFAGKLIELAGSPVVVKFFDGLFKFAAGPLFTNLGDSLVNFLRVMAVLGTESLPALERLTGGFGGMIDKFARWIEEAIQSGDFDRFMDKLFAALRDVGALLSSGKSFIMAIIGGPEQQAQAQSFFDDIIMVLDDLTAFFKSDDGRRAITAMIILAKVFLYTIEGVLLLFLTMLSVLDQIADAIAWIIDLLPGVQAPTVDWVQPRGTSTGVSGHADGGDFSKEHLAWISEGNRREVIIPMTDPARARQIADRSGLSSMLHSEQTVVNVYVGNEQLESYVDNGVQAGLGRFGSAMKHGPRTVGVGA